jgi:hypothetical protein
MIVLDYQTFHLMIDAPSLAAFVAAMTMIWRLVRRFNKKA